MLKKKEIVLSNGVKVKLFNTTKYKDINIYVTFINTYDKKEKASLRILRDIIGVASEKCPTKKEMTKRMNYLYSASVESITKVITYNICNVFHYNFVDPQYLENISLDDYLDFIDDTLFHALITDNIVNETKRLAVESINRKFEKPSIYSSNRILTLLAEYDERFQYLTAESEETICCLNTNDIKHVYEKMLNEANVEITIIGNINNELLKGLERLPFKYNEYREMKYCPLEFNFDKCITEEKKINQTSLVVSYKSKDFNIYNGNKYFSWIVGITLLGNLPCSLLFQELREKQSLCYTINVTDNKNEGLFFVHTLISKENIDKTIEEINNQLIRLENGDYSDEILDTCKKLMIDSYYQALDDVNTVFDYYLIRDRYSNMPFEEFVEGIRKVSKKDIQEEFKDSKHILSYILSDENGKTI